MKILFLGGTGNISTECADLLCDAGHEVLILSRGQRSVPARFRALRADRKDAASLRTALEGVAPDVVLNFIGYEVAELEIDFAVLNGRVRQYLFISSATVYTKPPSQLPITENAKLGNPLWDYAQKKFLCEQYLLRQWETTGFPVTIVRPTHTYSKRWVPSPVSSATYNFAARLEQGRPVFVPDDGQNPWTLTAASDFAVGLAGLLGNPAAVGEAFHITSDEVLTWNQIVAGIAAAVGAPSPIVRQIPTDLICQAAPNMTGTLKGDKIHPGVFDNSKIKRFVPAFECRKPFQIGIRESIAWLRAHPEDRIIDPQVEATMEAVLAAWDKSH